MIKILAIAIGLGVFVLVAICCVSWGVWKIRRRMGKRQISATPDENHDIPVENQKDAVLTFPTTETNDLKADAGANLRCPLCRLDFRDEDFTRRLLQCEHIFHRHCIDPLLDKEVTCPVCNSVVTAGSKASEKLNGTKLNPQETPLEMLHSKELSRTPSWVLVNRPVPLPRTALDNSSSSSERFEIELNSSDRHDGESPLLKHLTGSHSEDWNDVDLEKCIDISFTFGTDIPVEKRQQYSLSSNSEKVVDSFSFGISSTDAFTFGGLGAGALQTSSDAAAFRSSSGRNRGKDSSSSSGDFNPSARRSRSTSRSSRSTNSSSDSSFKQIANWEFGHPQMQELSEDSATNHLPLTTAPDESSFYVLPVITGFENHTLRSQASK